MINFAVRSRIKSLPSYQYMTSVIKYKCKCRQIHDIVPAYLHYVIEYMDMRQDVQLACPNDQNIIIPARKIYKNYLKQYEQEKKQVTKKNS